MRAPSQAARDTAPLQSMLVSASWFLLLFPEGPPPGSSVEHAHERSKRTKQTWMRSVRAARAYAPHEKLVSKMAAHARIAFSADLNSNNLWLIENTSVE